MLGDQGLFNWWMQHTSWRSKQGDGSSTRQTRGHSSGNAGRRVSAALTSSPYHYPTPGQGTGRADRELLARRAVGERVLMVAPFGIIWERPRDKRGLWLGRTGARSRSPSRGIDRRAMMKNFSMKWLLVAVICAPAAGGAAAQTNSYTNMLNTIQMQNQSWYNQLNSYNQQFGGAARSAVQPGQAQPGVAAG